MGSIGPTKLHKVDLLMGGKDLDFFGFINVRNSLESRIIILEGIPLG